MSKWYDKPTKISNIDIDYDYILCIDENGINNLDSIIKKVKNNEILIEDEKYFTITGCIFTRKNYLLAQRKINALKREYWTNGVFWDNKLEINKAVCFHSRDIRRHNYSFNENIINYDKFLMDLTNVLKYINCKIISISINLEEYIKRGYMHNVYNVAFDFLLERYIYETKNNKKGIIVLEARGKAEDKRLLAHINKVINITGTKKINSNELKNKIYGVYFNSKWNENYSKTYVGLEIADLFSYPIYKYVKRNVKDKAFLILEKKLVGYPNYKNKGLKNFP